METGQDSEDISFKTLIFLIFEPFFISSMVYNV